MSCVARRARCLLPLTLRAWRVCHGARPALLAEYVAAIEARHPGIGMFKVVPPPGWTASSLTPEEVDALHIATPIRQHVRRPRRSTA